MKFGLWLTASALTSLAIVGCGEPSGGAADAAAATPHSRNAQAAAAPATPPAGAPVRKAGLWRQTTNFGAQSQVTTICLDRATEEKLGWEGGARKSACHRDEMRPAPGGWEFVSSCKLGQAATMKYHGRVTGDLSSKYRVDIDLSTDGAAMPRARERKFTVTAEWKGPCPANMKPGDISVPGASVASSPAADDDE